jgi:hypothetical protein
MFLRKYLKSKKWPPNYFFSPEEVKKKSNASAQSSKGEDILQSLLSAQSAKEKADQQQR